MKRAIFLATVCLALAGCSHRRLNPVTVKVAPPRPVYLDPAPGRVVAATLVDLPPAPASAPSSPAPAETTPVPGPTSQAEPIGRDTASSPPAQQKRVAAVYLNVTLPLL